MYILFLPRDAMLARDAVVVCLSVCASVRLPQASTVLKRLNIGSCKQRSGTLVFGSQKSLRNSNGVIVIDQTKNYGYGIESVRNVRKTSAKRDEKADLTWKL